MTQTPPALIAVLLLGLALPASAATSKLALVIGNSTYQSLPALPNCAASANTVSSALRRAGFAVTVKSDLSNGEMGSAIAGFAAAPSTSSVLYICGYTIDYAGRDFLLPASASLDRDSDALTQGIAAKSMLDATASGPGARLALLDLVTAPKSAAASHFDSLATPPGLGFTAAVSANTPPEGATAFAASAAIAFAKPDLTLADAVAAIAQSGGGPGIAISHNAPPAPLWLLGGPAATAPAAPTPTPQSTQAALPDEAKMTAADRRQIQAALLRLGYYDRQADGIFGQETRAAIRRFQHEIGAPMTGTITPDQSAKLLAQQH